MDGEAQAYKDDLPKPNSEVPWLLLAEDDALFASLFCRFFLKFYSGQAKVTVVRSLTQLRACLLSSPRPPVFAVLDLNLEDGPSTDILSELNCPYRVWSATAENGIDEKPSGRQALEARALEIGRAAGLTEISCKP